MAGPSQKHGEREMGRLITAKKLPAFCSATAQPGTAVKPVKNSSRANIKRNIIAHRTVTIVEMYRKLAIAHRLKVVMLSFTGATV
ncbi:hypothetical protein DPX16_18016 [Anabarilius grahami]|uniref:Uncharacterized protein n=1 Tax=Anabarilius grahami TaxID=495550 RepID=A0A3N0XUI0_ANAGA|nr:hypothetical protein DPX16_18016 [Anabarilius grahami]